MLFTGYKTRLTAVAALTAAGLGAFAGARSAAADTFLSGFNSDLSSSLGVNWEVFGPSWSTRFGPQLTEGTGALDVTHNPNWQVGIKLPGGQALAQLVATSDTLEFDAVGTYGMAWRQVCFVMNANNETVGFQQTQQIDLPVPNVDEPGGLHVVVDLADARPDQDGAQNWKVMAQNWLNNPNPDQKTYFEFMFSFQGANLDPTADFNFDTFVDGRDFLTIQQNYGSTEAGAEQGDTNFDAIVDEVDLATWNFEFFRRTVSTIDNIKFTGGPAVGVASIPEPSTLVGGIISAGLAGLTATRRRRPRS